MDIDDRSADESHMKFRGERDVIRLRNPTEDKRAFRRMSTSADQYHRNLSRLLLIGYYILNIEVEGTEFPCAYQLSSRERITNVQR